MPVLLRCNKAYEKSKDGYSAYVPDLPGCTSAGSSREEIKSNIIEAINLYIEVLKDDKAIT